MEETDIIAEILDCDKTKLFYRKLAGLTNWIDLIYEERDDKIYKHRMIARFLIRKKLLAEHHEAMGRITPEETTWLEE